MPTVCTTGVHVYSSIRQLYHMHTELVLPPLVCMCVYRHLCVSICTVYMCMHTSEVSECMCEQVWQYVCVCVYVCTYVWTACMSMWVHCVYTDVWGACARVWVCVVYSTLYTLQKQSSSFDYLVATTVAPYWTCRRQYLYIQCGGNSIRILHKQNTPIVS